MNKDIFREDNSSQEPAVELLKSIGYEYIPSHIGESMRGNLYNPLLTTILRDKLKSLNSYEYKGKGYKFSDENIDKAIRDLDIPLTEGLINANEKIYDILMLGKSYEEFTPDGGKRSFNINFIDWENIENNDFYIVEEFSIERETGNENIRPDIVLFINGIPISVIECKRPSIPVEQGIEQMIRNQRPEYAPQLFKYIQLVMSTNKNETKYATCGTPKKFWSVWQEENIKWLRGILNHNITDRDITKQDQDIVSLFYPERILEIMKFFTLFDKNIKKIARYQQYFGVKEISKTVQEKDKDGIRKSGVIWHTQGSGKSLTMVMLSKYIFSELRKSDPKVIVVTDRINLDNQIYNTFLHTDLRPTKARTGRHLVELINDDGADVITTVVNKFETAADNQKAILSKDIFILVDESHRTQYGKLHNKMKQIFPNACYLGFTGTPLMKNEKNTMMKFGDLIHTYTISDAVRDKTILPLYYEGLMVEQSINQKAIDNTLDIITRGLTEKQVKEVKQEWSNFSKLASSDQRIFLIASRIKDHYNQLLKDTPFNAILATSGKHDAIRYLEHFESLGGIKANVIISSPDTREGHDSIDKESKDKEIKFWDNMMKKYGDEQTYETAIKQDFVEGEFDLLIVVNKLLTGFDAPRATVLYIDKPLKEHTLLQAIARVNRLYEGKDRGIIIDFRGLLGELDTAMDMYSGAGLDKFDSKDLQGAIYDSLTVIGELKESYSNLKDIFRNVKNKKDSEEYELILADEKVREDFYYKLTKLSKAIKLAISLDNVYNKIEDEIKKYEQDLKFYEELRKIVRIRYGDAIDLKELNPKMQDLMDKHIAGEEVIRITHQIDLTNKEDFREALEHLESPASKADAIRSRLSKSISHNQEKNPAYYKKFSEMIEEVLNEYKNKRISEKEYLENMYKTYDMYENNEDIFGFPEEIKHKPHAQAFYGDIIDIVKESNEEYITDDANEDNKNLIAKLSIEVENIIYNKAKVDWHNNQDVHNDIAQSIEDLLFEYKEKYNISLSFDQIDKIIDNAKRIAMKRF